jgi:hypothetical protein
LLLLVGVLVVVVGVVVGVVVVVMVLVELMTLQAQLSDMPLVAVMAES